MPVVTSATTQDSYDVIVVGSGAAGGQTAYTLTMAGAKVLVLEAGRMFNPVTESAMFQLPSQAPLRGASTPDKQYGFHDCSIASGWDIPGEPYTNASTGDATKFRWWRQRMLGGRTNHWGRIALRNGPYDFKPRTRDGVGFDWPISYDDIAPYYDKVEMLVGVFGTNEGIENSPDSSPGVLLPAPKLRVGELYAQKHGRKVGRSIISSHRAVLSTRQDADNIPPKLHPGNAKAQRILADSMRSRAACFWATDCHRGCAIKANYDSHTVHLTPALATGNLDILPNVMAREVTVNRQGKATGVAYIDKTTGKEGQVSARAVVLAASSQESVRLLLNSKSALFPQGLANSSGKVGKYITDSVGSSFSAHIPAFEGMPLHNEDGAGPHAYVPWTQHKQNHGAALGFSGGYHLEFASGRHMPSMSVANSFDGLSGRGGYAYGRQFKEDARRYYGCRQAFGAQGTMLPNDDCYSELDPVKKDQWGIPVLRFHWKWSDRDLKQILHQQQTIAELLDAMGGKFSGKPETADARKVARGAGSVIHEVGGAIMGDDPATSVTNKWSQTWDVKNVFMSDGAPFASTADKNPTLTIMALAWRAADHLLDELNKGNI